MDNLMCLHPDIVRMQAEIERLRGALKAVRVGCPTSEMEAESRYGAHWRNELIDKALASKEE